MFGVPVHVINFCQVYFLGRTLCVVMAGTATLNLDRKKGVLTLPLACIFETLYTRA